MNVQIKRIYLPAEESDGYRILTDRLWPRGISKEKAALDIWAKTIAPSPDLRKWFGHDAAKYDEFRTRYLAELAANPETASFVNIVKEHLTEGPVTLLFGAKDEEHNQAVVLKEYLETKA